ncbi:MAG TPA: MlaD family protein [Chlamydiales bacterium]|nr:MlaD family protein [Chlamydiales bacterium]
MTDQKKNILIGLFVAAALTIMIGMILFFEPMVGDGKKTLHVRFANIAGISVGTRVTFAGKPVGEVVQIHEIASAREETPDDTGRVFLYQLLLKVDSSVTVYPTDEIAVRTTGLMGEKSVAILPKALPKGKINEPVKDQIIYANSVDNLENTFTQVSKVASRMEATISHLDQWFNENQTYLTNVLKSFDGAMGQVNTFLQSVDNEHLVPAVRESVGLLNENMNYLRTSLDEDQLLHKFASLTENLNTATAHFNNDGAQTLRNLNQISRDISSGTGTLGRFITGDDFYLRLTSLFSKGETLMNDINHYGLLFQYDKHWQRSRTKKANLLKALDTPKEFRTYFEGEIDAMNTSIGRLTELLNRADGERAKIVQSDAFKKDFADLMRKVQGLSDSIKLYNEGLIAEGNL